MARSLGFWRCWAVVVGVMIGSGIFTVPALLAPYGSLSALGWAFAGAGALSVALTLSHLVRRMPKVGGPYAYTRGAFGDLPGFLVGWGYWIALWSSNAALGIGFAGYFAVFMPLAGATPAVGALVALALIWLFTGINIAGVPSAGVVQLVTTLLKLLPLFLVAASGLLLGDATGVPAANPNNEPLPLLIAGMVMITMWAYLGFETVTVPADDVVEPERTIPRALVAGTLTVTAVYMLVTFGVMALIPADELATSTSALADAASVVFGPWGASLVAVGALVSMAGAINGNILATGMMPLAIAKDGLFPARFADVNGRGAPAFALTVSGVLSSVLIVMNYTRGLLAAFQLLILLATLTSLLPYAACALADITLQRRDAAAGKGVSWKSLVIAVGALAFSLFTIAGTGLVVSAYGLVLLAVGLGLYYWQRGATP